ncbi:choice-of-anchor P family protein [Streptomyces sp. NPDC020192]|uniref:choice-of-anchor P family protein n=1 Tax=Streptomyces sp. NPDC020192 TaxID=3365066 RepID=UPI0037B51D06
MSAPGDLSQSASATTMTPFANFAITTVPFGKTMPGNPDLGVASAAEAANWQRQLALAQGGVPQKGVTISAFGQKPTGIYTQPRVDLDQSGLSAIDRYTWVLAAGNRLWVIRAEKDHRYADASNFAHDLVISSPKPDVPTTMSTAAHTAALTAAPKATSAGVPGIGSRPSWWSGDCDVNHAPGETMQNSWQGLESCGNFSGGHSHGTEYQTTFPGGGPKVSEFQCVELPTRYAYQAWGIPVQSVGHGYNFANAYNGLTDRASGQKLVMYGHGNPYTTAELPKVGDVIASGDISASNGDGHVGIVVSATYDRNYSATLKVMDENFNPGGSNTIIVSNGVVHPFPGMVGVSWLHDPAGSTPPPPPPSAPSLTVHGISNGQALTGPITLTASVDNNTSDGKENLTHEHYYIDGTLVAGTDGAGEGSLGGPPSGSTSPGYAWTLDPVKHTGSSTKVASWTIPANLLTPGVTHQIWADGTNSAGETGTSAKIGFTVPSGPKPSVLTYTGPKTADYHDAFTASASLTSGGKPITGATVSFALGNGGPGQTCSATTDANGSANCPLTPGQAAGSTTLTADFTGNDQTLPSHATAAFAITREETTLTYSGPSHLTNGVSATLSGILREDGAAPVAGRPVTIAIGSGTAQQSCTGNTDGSGTVSCTIPTLNQPLNDTATLPVTPTFAGDPFYLASTGPATARLEYFTGRAFGLSAQVNALLLSLKVPPTPDTGAIRTAQASRTAPPCTATVNTLLINAAALCADGSTALTPGTATMTASLQQTTIGLPGLPLIGLGGVTSTSVSTCSESHGSATMKLTIAGVPVTVPTAPNSVIKLAGGAELIINEQLPTPGADHGLTVNAVHLIALGGLADVVVASSTSGAHNCA